MSPRQHLAPIRSIFSNSRTSAALGVFAAGLLLAEVNVLAARHYERWDLSPESQFTLSESTRRLLEVLDRKVTVTVLLGAADPLLPDVRQTLASYRSHSPNIRVSYLDPDRDPAEFLAFSKRVEVEAEALRGGAAEGAAIVVEAASRTWIISSSRLSSFDDEGRRVLHLEQELTEAIARVDESDLLRACFVTGHAELSIDDHAPEGLLELRHRLERSNVEIQRIPMDVPEPQKALVGCDAVAIIGPGRAWPREHVEIAKEAHQAGTPFLVFLDPLVGGDGKTQSIGLGALLESMGAIAEPAFVLELEPSRRLPTGFGETFFAEPKLHRLTDGLTTESARMDSRVVVRGAMPVRVFPGASARAVLSTSKAARIICDLNHPELDSCPEDLRSPPGSNEKQPLDLAIASEKPIPDRPSPLRSVVVGSSSLAQNVTFQDPASYGSRVFVENAFAWVLDRPALVSIPEQRPVRAGVRISEESLGEVLRYVLIYMPLFAAGLGALVLFRRNRREQASRSSKVEA